MPRGIYKRNKISQHAKKLAKAAASRKEIGIDDFADKGTRVSAHMRARPLRTNGALVHELSSKTIDIAWKGLRIQITKEG